MDGTSNCLLSDAISGLCLRTVRGKRDLDPDVVRSNRRSEPGKPAASHNDGCNSGSPLVSHLHYLPLSLPFFSILVGIFVCLAALIEVGVLGYAYALLGIGPRAVLFLLLASLIGSYFNIPVATLPGEQVFTGRELTFYGVQYAVPIMVDWPGTVIAVNVGGALVPSFMSLYLLRQASHLDPWPGGNRLCHGGVPPAGASSSGPWNCAATVRSVDHRSSRGTVAVEWPRRSTGLH